VLSVAADAVFRVATFSLFQSGSGVWGHSSEPMGIWRYYRRKTFGIVGVI